MTNLFEPKKKEIPKREQTFTGFVVRVASKKGDFSLCDKNDKGTNNFLSLRP
jgi:hypothetical protein